MGIPDFFLGRFDDAQDSSDGEIDGDTSTTVSHAKNIPSNRALVDASSFYFDQALEAVLDCMCRNLERLVNLDGYKMTTVDVFVNVSSQNFRFMVSELKEDFFDSRKKPLSDEILIMSLTTLGVILMYGDVVV